MSTKEPLPEVTEPPCAIGHIHYEPRAGDPPIEEFANRIAECNGCRFRDGQNCTSAKQLCSVLARAGSCPLGFWGDPAAPIAAPKPLRKSSHVLPPPAGNPLIGPSQAAEPIDQHRFPPLAWSNTRRNLICHLLPLTAGQRWKRTVAHLAARQAVFNGRRIVAIAVDHNTDTTADVAAEFARLGMEVLLIEFPNDPNLGEVVSFPTLLRETLNRPADLTFYCHSKGSTWPESSSLSHEWANVMFSACLDYPRLVEQLLNAAATCGAFRRQEPLAGSAAKWHFSGTFFWFRHDVATSYQFGLCRQPCESTWSGVEGWPGNQFPIEHSACLFLDQAADLYHAHYWDSTVRPAWRQWKELP